MKILKKINNLQNDSGDVENNWVQDEFSQVSTFCIFAV